MRAGRYEAEWTGTVDPPSQGRIGFVAVCYAACTRPLGTAQVDSATYLADTRTIAKIPFLLREAVSDIEFRFFITEKATVTLERVGFHGGPVSADGAVSRTGQ